MLLTAGAIVVGALVVRMVGGGEASQEAQQPPTGVAAVALADGASNTQVAKPTGPSRAQQWEAVATVLGELERHVNRAKLQFADIPDLEAAAQELVQAQMREQARAREEQEARARLAPGDSEVAAPGGGAAPPNQGVPSNGAPGQGQGQGQGAAAPVSLASRNRPSAAPQVDQELQQRAQKMWADWRRSWASDLAFAIKGLPDRSALDLSVRTSFDAVRSLATRMQQVPGGNPPGRSQRDAWLRGLFEQVHTARTAVDAARAG